MKVAINGGELHPAENKSRVFSLPGKKRIRDSNGRYKTIIVDATEQRIEKPQDSKKQKDSYSGKRVRSGGLGLPEQSLATTNKTLKKLK